jgi:DNA repair exonuclease SbcCD nuclease subunit
MIRIVCISDTHLGFDLPQRISALPHRGEDFFANTARALSHARQINAAAVIHAGDLFFRSKVPAAVVDRVYGMLQDFADTGIPLYIVPGNHERAQLPGSILMFHPGIHIFYHPGTFVLDTTQGRVAISGFPFIRQDAARRSQEVMHQLASDHADAQLHLLVLHQIIEHARVAAFTFQAGPDVISHNAIPAAFDALICGHIHRSQVLYKESPQGILPIIHPGSIERTSFQEMHEAKSFVEMHWQPGTPLRWSTVPLPSRPMVQIIIPEHLSRSDILSYLRQQAKILKPDSIVQIKSTDSVSLPSAATLRSILPAGCILHYSRPVKRAR